MSPQFGFCVGYAWRVTALTQAKPASRTVWSTSAVSSASVLVSFSVIRRQVLVLDLHCVRGRRHCYEEDYIYQRAVHELALCYSPNLDTLYPILTGLTDAKSEGGNFKL